MGIVWEMCRFWWECLSEGAAFTWEIFGRVDLALAAITYFLLRYRSQQEQKWKTKWEPTMKKFTVDFIIWTFIVSVIFIAPFKKFHEAEESISKATNEIAQLKAPKSNIIRWQPPEVNLDIPKFCVYVGGHFDREDSSPMYVGLTPMFLDIHSVKIQHGKTNIQMMGNTGPYELPLIFEKNRFFVNVSVPTKTKPIVIEAGESGPLPDGWDWNSDAYTLEIVDDQNQAVFQEIYRKDITNSVWLKGAIQFGGMVIVITDYGPNLSTHHGTFNTIDAELTTIFEYPSSTHQGKRIRK